MESLTIQQLEAIYFLIIIAGNIGALWLLYYEINSAYRWSRIFNTLALKIRHPHWPLRFCWRLGRLV